MTVAQIESTMYADELAEWVAEDKLRAFEAKQAREKARRQKRRM